MNISILTVFPELYQPFLSTSIVGRAQENNVVNISVRSFFDAVKPKERIDAPPFGPGPGMLIKPTVVQILVQEQEEKHGSAYKIFFSPHGKLLDQADLQRIATLLQSKKHVMCLAGRYEGMDARVEEYYADEIVSIGNLVLMGGDLPVMMLVEGMLRLIPDVVGKQESVERDSFTGPFVDYPSYTQPVEWEGYKVPDIMRSGNHEAIEQWRYNQVLERTLKHHVEWLRSQPLTVQEKKDVLTRIPTHYIALMHTDVLLPHEQVGTTSVTSMDIHDGARSAKTYGIKKYFIVTPLLDQQKIVSTLLDFWLTGGGKDYNPYRFYALQLVRLVSGLHDVIEAIRQEEGIDPLIVTTSARSVDAASKGITYFDQSLVWQHKKPVLFLFGTGKGLSENLIDRADYCLVPVEGMTDFNHLSVRSAIAIILDRWLGLNPKKVA